MPPPATKPSIRERMKAAGFTPHAGVVLPDEIAPGVPKPTPPPERVEYVAPKPSPPPPPPVTERETQAFERVARMIPAIDGYQPTTWGEYIHGMIPPIQVGPTSMALRAQRMRREIAIEQAANAMRYGVHPLTVRDIFEDVPDVLAAADARIAAEEAARTTPEQVERISRLVSSIQVYQPGPVETEIMEYLRATGTPMTQDLADIINTERKAGEMLGRPDEVAAAERMSALIDFWSRPIAPGHPSLRDLLVYEARTLYTSQSYGALEELYHGKEMAWHWILIGDEMIAMVLLAPLIANVSRALVAVGMPIRPAQFLAALGFWRTFSETTGMLDRATRKRPPLRDEATRRWELRVTLLDRLLDIAFSIPGHWSIGLVAQALLMLLHPEEPTAQVKLVEPGSIQR